jgi:ferredoxin
VKIHVDPALCVGHNRCAALAPDLFDIDDEGFASAARDGIVPPDRVDAAELAVDNCPEQAITLEGDV